MLRVQIWAIVPRMATNARSVTELTEALSREIRAERARQRRSQKEIYEDAGLSRSTFARIEAATRGLDFEQLIRVSDALGIKASELVRRAEESPRPSAVLHEQPASTDNEPTSGYTFGPVLDRVPERSGPPIEIQVIGEFGWGDPIRELPQEPHRERPDGRTDRGRG